MIHYSLNPTSILSCLWQNRQLAYSMIRREISGRYRGSTLGILWSLVIPLLMLSIYTFVFSIVFKARWGSTGDSKTEFALLLFAGLTIFNFFSECINRAPSLVQAHTNYVKKVIFPLEILPWIALGSAFFQLLISFIIWFIAFFIFNGLPNRTVFYLPIVLLPYVFLILGLSWFLASLGVYLRDISQIIGVITTIILFMSPIFYPVSALPETYQQFIYLNPLTLIIEQVRNVVYWGKSPDWLFLLSYSILSILIAWCGFIWYQKTRKGFADVL